MNNKNRGVNIFIKSETKKGNAKKMQGYPPI